MEKKNTGLIVLVVVLSIAVLGLGGFIVYDKVLKSEKEDNNKIETNNNQMNQSNNINKLDDTKEIVYTEISYNITGHNDEMNGLSEIPQINLDTKNTIDININIIDFFKKIMKTNKFKNSYKYGHEETDDHLIYKINYEYYIENNILSLLITYIHLSEAKEEYSYIIYNINTETGEILSNNDLIYIKNYSAEQIRNTLIKNIDNYYKSIFDKANIEYKYGNTVYGIDLYKSSEEIKNLLSKYIDSNNIYLPLYINSKGILNTYMSIPVDGGSGYDTITIPLQ
ncbi:MAG: hypothetical protein IJO32_05680 [Bacilli bacterium]|nr:hypothetical protein [Bacilli bacterium]